MTNGPYREGPPLAESREPWGMWLRRWLAGQWGRSEKVQVHVVVLGVLAYGLIKLYMHGVMGVVAFGVISTVLGIVGLIRIFNVVEI